MVGPFDVFTGATLNLAARNRFDDGYDVTIASVGGEPVTTGTGLVLVAQPLPDPHGPIDTVVLPGGWGLDEARKNPDVVDWVKAVSGTARRVVSVCTGAFLAAAGGTARRLPGHDALGVRGSSWPVNSPLSQSIPIRSSCTVRRRCGRPRASPRASTSRCRWSRRTTAPRSRRRSRAIWCCICDAPADRASSPRRCGCLVPSESRSVRSRRRSRPNPVQRTASPSWRAARR